MQGVTGMRQRSGPLALYADAMCPVYSPPPSVPVSQIVEWMAANEQLMSVIADGPMEEQFAPVLAGALTFGDASVSLKVKSIMEV